MDNFEKVKSVELEILKEFMKVCDQLNLKWYAGYGTTLGAVRHGGFIPWDDDIDVVMPRPDYEKFLNEAQKLFPAEYFIQTLDTEPEYYQPFAKVRKSDTTFWEIGTKDDKINHGIYIDIFPLDGYPTGWLSEKVFMLKRVVYDNCIYQDGDINKLTGYRKIIARMYQLFAGKLSKREAAYKKEALIKKVPYEQGALVSCLVCDTPKAEAVTPDVYGEGSSVLFEDVNVILPSDSDQYLKKLYGDYMQFPPEDQRVPLHTCLIIDTEKSYLEYHK